ncbi:hypothetical protein G3O08_09435 [Cryomorpha ignava]|uniref:Adenylosuccinate synthetase n=1 Tax=Cryomorpha ignava TaxID=101383 RepID=A0A7K3WRP6_9FLAO|nr:hypothetical protein [Cryomorpha ignava]NEN23721.1 hypothetical protein [Cryomorpha ignava]
MKIYNSIQAAIFTVICLIASSITAFAQLPDGVDAGQSDEAVSIYQQPKYIIPIVVFIILAIAFYFWQKRSKK